MNNIIASNATEIEIVDELLGKKIPTYRQAYSDRTSWLMACFSELAYLKFNPLFLNENQKELATKCLDSFVSKKKTSDLLSLLNIIAYDDCAELEKLNSELCSLNAKLVKTFDSNGTQAILISTNKHITLAFRGTEITSIKDIKSDVTIIKTKCESGGYIHSGFKKAFEEVENEIQSELKKADYKNMPLFITGHSLGGALATIAAKKLNHSGGMASCYTFGSPRVGDDDWVSNIKTPLHRVVNAADCVTIMPPSSNVTKSIALTLGYIPYFGNRLKRVIMHWIYGYMHGGNMRYLTNCDNGNYNSVKLLYSVSLLYRLRMWFNYWKLTKPLADHSIAIYRKKLAIIAKNRN